MVIGDVRRIGYPEGRACHVRAIQRQCDAHGFCQSARASREQGEVAGAAPPLHQADALQGLYGPDEDGFGDVLGLRHDVEAAVVSVREVDVGVARGAEHGLVAFRFSDDPLVLAGTPLLEYRVAGGVVLKVCLGLHYAAGCSALGTHVNENLAEEAARHLERWQQVEGARKGASVAVSHTCFLRLLEMRAFLQASRSLRGLVLRTWAGSSQALLAVATP